MEKEAAAMQDSDGAVGRFHSPAAGPAHGADHSPGADRSPSFRPRPDDAHRSWRRVVVKLSGEAFAGAEPVGIDPDVVIHLAEEIAAAAREGVQVAAVVGGGN